MSETAPAWSGVIYGWVLKSHLSNVGFPCNLISSFCDLFFLFSFQNAFEFLYIKFTLPPFSTHLQAEVFFNFILTKCVAACLRLCLPWSQLWSFFQWTYSWVSKRLGKCVYLWFLHISNKMVLTVCSILLLKWKSYSLPHLDKTSHKTHFVYH